ncbi:MAG: hypothetical protein AB6733_15800 [Clostridiaceae bacterium]
MSKFITGKFIRALSSFMKSEEKEVKKQKSNYETQISNEISCDKVSISERTWKKEYKPLRQMILWGRDEENNPGFLIFYGRQDFEDENQGILKEEIKYTYYAIFKGKQGHLPSFEAVKIIEDDEYSNNRSEYPAMYYKKGIKYSWYWQTDEKYKVKEFQVLNRNEEISLPYFKPLSYEENVSRVLSKNIKFHGFTLAKNPNEVLKLVGDDYRYFEVIRDLLSKNNIYLRKKALKELISMHPSKDIYLLLLKLGSTEVISGLFLELAKLADPILLEEAKALIDAEINWSGESYVKGLKRCIKIYLNSLDENLREERINWIRKSISDIDLNLIRIKGKDIPKEKVISGHTYRKYAIDGLLRDYYHDYDYDNHKYIKKQSPMRYKKSIFTDGRKLNVIELKNIIQEAEIYNLADVIGKAAYYLDAPRLTYYLKGNGNTKALKYFHRYLKRIINAYSECDEERFIEVMKNLFTQYSEDDYVCKFINNFQFNEFIKYYLYYDFKEKPPVGDTWESWRHRSEWMENDKLMTLEGRYEFKKDIWDKNLDVVAEIAMKTRVNAIAKACYYILKDSPKFSEFIENISWNLLVNLTASAYTPLKDMFMNILKEKLDNLDSFDSQIMICLIGHSDSKVHEYAMNYFYRTGGLFSPSDVADLLLLENIETFEELFKKNLFELNENQYVEFIISVINNSNKFLEMDKEVPESIKDMIYSNNNKIQNLSKEEKQKLIIGLMTTLYNKQKSPEWVGTLIEDLIFTFSYEQLKSILEESSLDFEKKKTSVKNKRIISLLESIKDRNIPKDSEIINILEVGTAKTIKVLFSIMSENSEKLKNRFSTLLIMLESNVTALNNMAEDLFDQLPKEEQKKLHGIIIDSPVQKVFTFGLKKLDLIYGEIIPGEFIIQMLEHTSDQVKKYISNKTDRILDDLGEDNKELFMYYIRTLLFLPNKLSVGKDRVYGVIPKFISVNKDKLAEVEEILLDIGGSNIIVDSERALTALAKIRGEVC